MGATKLFRALWELGVLVKHTKEKTKFQPMPQTWMNGMTLLILNAPQAIILNNTVFSDCNLPWDPVLMSLPSHGSYPHLHIHPKQLLTFLLSCLYGAS